MTTTSKKMDSLIKTIIFNALDDMESQNLTPHFAVNCSDMESNDLLSVPAEFVNNQRIVLNLKPQAVLNFHLHHTHLTFSARFRGVSRNVSVPYSSIEFIYSLEVTKGKQGIPMYFVDLSNKEYLKTLIDHPSITPLRGEQFAEEKLEPKKKVVLRAIDDEDEGVESSLNEKTVPTKARVKPVLKPVE